WTSGLGVLAIAIDPTDSNRLYASASGTYASPYGVFGSTDGGASWNATNFSSLCSDGAHDLAIDPLTPTTLYAAANNCGVLRSTDGGLTWSPFNNGLTPGGSQQ